MPSRQCRALSCSLLSFSREDEREADALGSEYATKMAYDGTKMADFYKVLIRMNL